MKTLLMISGLILGLSAWAGPNHHSTWDEIFSDYNVQVDEPKIAFDLRFVSVFKTCLLDDSIRTASKVPIERRIPIGNENDKWEVIGHDYLYAPIHYQKYICQERGGDNCDLKRVWEIRKTSYNVAVRSIPQGENSFGRVLFTKKFNIPNCMD